MIFSDCYVTDFRFQQSSLKQWLAQTEGSFIVFPLEHWLLTTLWSIYNKTSLLFYFSLHKLATETVCVVFHDTSM